MAREAAPGLIDLDSVGGYPFGMDGNRTGGAAGGDIRPRSFGFGKLNLAFLAAGAVAVLFGYVLLSGGSVTVAPLLLVAGYVVLIPLGLLLGFRGADRGGTEDGGGE